MFEEEFGGEGESVHLASIASENFFCISDMSRLDHEYMYRPRLLLGRHSAKSGHQLTHFSCWKNMVPVD